MDVLSQNKLRLDLFCGGILTPNLWFLMVGPVAAGSFKALLFVLLINSSTEPRLFRDDSISLELALGGWGGDGSPGEEVGAWVSIVIGFSSHS